MLRWRTATALVLAPLVLGAIALGRPAVFAVVFIVVAGAAYELSQALRALPFAAALGAGALPLVLAVPFGTLGILAGALLALPWVLVWFAAREESRTLGAALAALLMALWVGAPMAHLLLFPRNVTGMALILVAVVGPWISDSGAFFAGRFFGRHLLLPSLSPNKTVEGSAGGLLATVVVVGTVSYWFLGYPVAKAVILGFGVSAFSQAGDLFESALKRILDVKDLGRMLPGHGGLLDRIDSLLFTAPAVYYLSLLL